MAPCWRSDLALQELRDELELAQIRHHAGQFERGLDVALLDRALHELRRGHRRGGRVDCREQRAAFRLQLDGIAWRSRRATLPIWPFSLLIVPSAAMLSLTSVAPTWMRATVPIEQRVAAVVHDAAGRREREMPGTGEPRAGRGLDREITVAGDGEIERIPGLRQRARLTVAIGRSVGGVGERLASPPASALPPSRTRKSLKIMRPARKPGVAALAMLVAVTSIARAARRGGTGRSWWRSPWRASECC